MTASHDSLRKAGEMLGGLSLRDLLGTSALLSILEYFDRSVNGVGFLFPALNFQKIARFDKAVLATNSSEANSSILTGAGFGEITNLLFDVIEADDKNQKAAPSNEFFPDFLLRTGNAQMRFQHDDLHWRLAKTYAMLQVFPEKYKEPLVGRHGNNFVDIPQTVSSTM